MAKRGNLNKKKAVPTNNPKPKTRKYAQYFLIVCEDQNTEPAYFRYFKKLFDTIESPKETIFLEILGTGFSPLGIVQKAVELKNNASKEIDFVWVVFDIDDAAQNSTTIDNFNAAFRLAKAENIKIAYSNEVFELWLLLHLKAVSPNLPIPRSQIYIDLQTTVQNHSSKYATFQYLHGKSDIIDIIFEIGNENEAIKKAKALLAQHQKIGTIPLYANPSTTQHILVNDLRQWLQYYLYD